MSSSFTASLEPHFALTLLQVLGIALLPQEEHTMSTSSTGPLDMVSTFNTCHCFWYKDRSRRHSPKGNQTPPVSSLLASQYLIAAWGDEILFCPKVAWWFKKLYWESKGLKSFKWSRTLTLNLLFFWKKKKKKASLSSGTLRIEVVMHWKWHHLSSFRRDNGF